MKAVALPIALAVACASALHEPSPIAALAPGHAHGRSADELVRDGDQAWQKRAQPGQAAAAQDLYLDAAAADDHRIDGLLGAMRAISFRIERERDAPRGALAGTEVELGQWCVRRAPAEPACAYRLAIALGQQAREHPSTGEDALGKMVELLHAAIANAPRLDDAGPERVLALLLLRAPAWPAGPGDPDAGLVQARAAAELVPGSSDNQAVLGEALAATGAAADARAAYQRALALATAAQTAGDPDAEAARATATAGLAKLGAP